MNIYNRYHIKEEKLRKQIKCFSIGKSEEGKNIYCFEVGKGDKSIVVQGGIHAREYITSFLILEMIEYLNKFEHNIKIYFIPLVNPDGFNICINGIKNLRNKKRKDLIQSLLKFENKKNFKANANGIDLNTNFDALWGQGKQNIKDYPWFENFIGFQKNSEKETQSLINFTKNAMPSLTLSYHSKGQVFYYGFKNYFDKNHLIQRDFVRIIENVTNYKPLFTKNSCGGYKDYCMINYNIMGFTLEVGKDSLKHPINLNHLKEIFEENKNLILKLEKRI